MTSRAIKFRTWDGENILTSYEIIPMKRGKKLVIKIGVKDEFQTEETYVGFQPIALMQFTGLLDKNGKEIYEGDICKMPTGDYPVQVSWDYSGWEFLTRDGLQAESFSGFHDEYEIIGNIYENPELLK